MNASNNYIYFISQQSSSQILYKNLQRSFTKKQVRFTTSFKATNAVYVFDSNSLHLSVLKELEQKDAKVIVFGKLSEEILSYLNIETVALSPQVASIESAKAYNYSESVAYLKANPDNPIASNYPFEKRPLKRFDFMDEWNNMGYPNIGIGNAIWDIPQAYNLNTNSVLDIYTPEQKASVLFHRHLGRSEFLFFSRPVGFSDSYEDRVFVDFISNYASHKLPCVPSLLDTPYGYEFASTMRLDCDENIESSRDLFSLYQQEGVPLSLAIKTDIFTKDSQIQFLKEVEQSGGAILSHSHSHPVSWGANFEEALNEAKKSKQILEDKLNHKIDYAVSPFHTNAPYAVTALEQAGYKAFVAGIVNSDPEYLLSSGGNVAAAEEIVSHSQQFMLHGDCILEAEMDPLKVYKKAIEARHKAKVFFGYLDHPFSEYQYGWKDEEQRLKVHQLIIHFIKEKYQVLFVNENEALDFIRKKATSILHISEDVISLETNDLSQYPLAIEYKGRVYSEAEVKV